MRRLLLAVLLALTGPVTAAPRVVSLAPSLTEILHEIHADDLLVGEFGHGQPNLERLLSLKPDLVLFWPGSLPPTQQAQLERLGVPLFSADAHTLDELIAQIEAIGVRVGREAAARQRAGQLRERLAELRQQYRRASPLKVFYQVWDKPLYTLGGGQIVSDALKVCGARNVFDDLSQPAPLVSVESVLARRPQIILAGDAARLEGWRGVDALKLVVPDNGLERPSGQMIEATAKLCALLDARVPASR